MRRAFLPEGGGSDRVRRVTRHPKQDRTFTKECGVCVYILDFKMAAYGLQSVTWLVFCLLFYLFVPTDAELCYSGNIYASLTCEYGCCGYPSSYCCPKPSYIVGPIVGSLVSFGVFIVILIIGICLCRRRRRQPGVVIYSQGTAPGVTVQQSTQSSTLNTAGLAQGIVYPPYPYSSAPYAAAPPNQPDGGAQQPQPPPGYFYQAPPTYNNLPPPAYPTVVQNQGGVVNPAFKS
ncbi:hypothetical protein Btru_038843 [Bulinus truncatus]|nr:hypothetical protein Btru_038843 [Bulinus truncatus]